MMPNRKRSAKARQSASRGPASFGSRSNASSMGIPTFASNTRAVDEVKFLDYSNGPTTLSDSGSAILMNGCIQGLDALNDRIGRKILMKKITCRYTAGVPTASLTSGTGYQNNGDTVRAILVFDKQANGAAATYASLMNISGTFNAPLANRSISTLDRFIVLADRVHQLSVSGPNTITGEFVVPCNLETVFTTTNNGDITDIISGSVYMFIVDANATANLPGAWAFVSRIEFLDA